MFPKYVLRIGYIYILQQYIYTECPDTGRNDRVALWTKRSVDQSGCS